MATSVSLTPAEVNLTVYDGDSINVRFVLTFSDGSVWTIPAVGTGGTGWKGSIVDSVTGIAFDTFALTGVAGTNYVTAYLSPTKAATFDPTKTYKYDIEYGWGATGSTYLKTLVKGTITVGSQVTV